MRSSLTAAIALVAALFVVGCAQPSSLTSPSSPSSLSPSPSSPSSPSSSASVSGSTSSALSASNFSPVLAQLNRVDNLLVGANHHLNLFLEILPDGTTLLLQPAMALVGENFYEDADHALVDDAPNYSPFVQGTDALSAIIRESQVTLDLLKSVPESPVTKRIKAHAQHIIVVATTLINCTKDPCWPPVQ